MKIDKILSGIRQSQETTKEASEQAAPPASLDKTAAPRDALVGALNTALSTDKVASEKTSPVTDVMKVAEEMAGIEHEVRIKEAQVMGAALADAFVARLGKWQTKAAELNATATPAPVAAPVPASTSYGKVAAENPGLVNQAQQLGYDQTKAALEKQSDESYVQGFNDTVSKIHKTAAHEFLKGAAIMSHLLDATAAS